MKSIAFLFLILCPTCLLCQAQVWSSIELEYYLPFRIENLCNQDTFSRIIISSYASKRNGKKKKWKNIKKRSEIIFQNGKRTEILNFYSKNTAPDTASYEEGCFIPTKKSKICCKEKLVYCFDSYEFIYDNKKRLIRSKEKDTNNWNEFIYQENNKIPSKEIHYHKGKLSASSDYVFDYLGRLKEIKCVNSEYTRFINFIYDEDHNSIEVIMGFDFKNDGISYWLRWLIEY